MAKAAKLSKAEVQYEHPAAKSDHCGICRHYEPPTACEVVSGLIRPEDWCDHFSGSRARKRYGR